jgi:hypothetical protein
MLTQIYQFEDQFGNPIYAATDVNGIFVNGQSGVESQPTPGSMKLVSSNGIYTAILSKSDKVTGASQGELAALDSTGNLIGSGKNISDLDDMVSITWSSLKSLRDNSSLVPGRLYRITDYTCTTTQENTQSAGHQFDIIVTADSNSELNENAKAALHSGDTYFSGCSVNAWELKYCIDNDDTRFSWADTTNGKGVVYWMKDEWNNECPYDFKNIQYKRYRISECLNSPDLEGLFGIDGGNGYTVDTGTTYWCYTFCMIDTRDDSAHDVSVEQEVYMNDEGYYYHTHDNVFKSRIEGDYDADPVVELLMLPNNVMVTDTDITSIEEGYGEFYAFTNNTFGRLCYNNTFGNDCNSNTFGNSCFNNTFGNDCNSNTFGNNNYNNTFGNYCTQNTFGNDCYSNTFGNYFQSNTFGNGCGDNTFGNYFQSNTFGNDCFNNTFGNDYIGQCSFGDGVQYCRISKSYFYNNIIENGNQYITITSTQTTSSSNVLRNIKIAQGVNNTSTMKTISHNTVNDTFQTVYQPVNSQIISV